MSDTPTQAISIRQPWAWLIVNGYKDIENRDWLTKKRGVFYIHAGKSMTKSEYEDCEDDTWVVNPDIVIPEPKALLRGGIVGIATITDCVADSESPWFFGEYGFVIKNAKPCEFIPCKGSLNFFYPEINQGAS